MESIKFKEVNVEFAGDRPGYKKLSAFYDKTQTEGVVLTCYKFSFAERLRVLFRGRLWLSVMTFNSPLQPQFPSTKKSDHVKVIRSWK